MSRNTSSSSRRRRLAAVGVVLGALLVFLVPGTAHAHCDSMDGPIVPLARKALENGELTPVLKWVRKQDENRIRTAFRRARAIRGQDSRVREIADLWFLETLIRVHREGEGEPYTGLKPAGSIKPVFAAADAALDSGSVDKLAKKIAESVRHGIEKRFAKTLARRQQAEESVEQGRDYVRAYVSYMHFVETIDAVVRRSIR